MERTNCPIAILAELIGEHFEHNPASCHLCAIVSSNTELASYKGLHVSYEPGCDVVTVQLDDKSITIPYDNFKEIIQQIVEKL